MNDFTSLSSSLTNKDWQAFAFKVGGGTAITTICGYGGTFFFTTFKPKLGATYIGISTLISLIAYELFELSRSFSKPTPWTHVIRVIQLLQFPLVFHFVQGNLSAAVKLEMISATAYFIAIPVFFHFAMIAWDEPSVQNIGTAMGVMLPLASKLADYAKAFK